MGTLQTLVRRAYDICSTNKNLQNELSHINKVFHEQNQYPFWAISFFAKLNKVTTYNCKNNTNNNYQQTQHTKKYQTAKNISCFSCIKGKGLII